jgi:hypothetical protein
MTLFLLNLKSIIKSTIILLNCYDIHERENIPEEAIRSYGQRLAQQKHRGYFKIEDGQKRLCKVGSGRQSINGE